MRTVCDRPHKSSFNLIIPTELNNSPVIHQATISHMTSKDALIKRPSGLLNLIRSFFSVVKASSQFHDHHQDFAHFVVISGSGGGDHMNNSTSPGVPLLMRYPEFLSKYSLLPKKVIGKGTFGTIHLASSKSDPSRLFAVKIFNKCRSKTATEAYFTHLSSEFLIGVSLHHKNIVETYELVKYGPTWLEIMEYCKGGDLFESIQKNRLSQKVANFFFTELLSGIHYLHSLGIAHCDLKPENILISSDNHVKIADFGASCHFSILNKKSYQQNVHPIEEMLCQGICGSLPYTAPEILTMGPYDPAPVDIWSLGIIYFVMIFHKIPWNEASIHKDERYEKYLSQRERYDPIYRLPVQMAKILCRMLEPDPCSRITINELVDNVYIQHLNID